MLKMGLPTLLIRGMYEFPEGVELNENDKRMLNKLRPIEIVIEILQKKLFLQSSPIPIIFLHSMTGSGKSTVLPPYIYTNLLKKSGRGLLMAEPRVNLCDNAINDIRNYYRNWTLGKELAIHTGQKKFKSSDKEFIEFATTQVIQNFLNSIFDADTAGNVKKVKSLLNKYLIIVIDEAHILEIQTLNVIQSIKKLLLKFSHFQECPTFIFMSATINIDQYLKYLDLEHVNKKYLISIVKGVPNNPIAVNSLSNGLVANLNIKGVDDAKFHAKTPEDIIDGGNPTNKPIKLNPFKTTAQFFMKFCYSDLWKSKSFVEIDEFNKEFQCRDALIFVPTILAITGMINEISSLIEDKPSFKLYRDTTEDELIKWRNENKGKQRVLLMGYSAEYSKPSLKLLEKPYEVDEDVLENETKIIISTSVIETGKTIQMLRLCIDMGFDTKTVYNPLIYIHKQNRLMKIPANQSQINQRKGRVGRKAPGIFIMMYSTETFGELLQYDLPETINSGCLSELIYINQLSKINKSSRIEIGSMNDYLYPISPDLLIRTMNDLFFGNIIGSNGEYNMEKVEERWIIYAQLAYYMLKMPLFRAIMTAVINKYKLPNLYQIYKFGFDSFFYDLDKCVNDRYSKAIDFIPEGRQLFLDIMNGKSKAIIPYRKDWY